MISTQQGLASYVSSGQVWLRTKQQVTDQFSFHSFQFLQLGIQVPRCTVDHVFTYKNDQQGLASYVSWRSGLTSKQQVRDQISFHSRRCRHAQLAFSSNNRSEGESTRENLIPLFNIWGFALQEDQVIMWSWFRSAKQLSSFSLPNNIMYSWSYFDVYMMNA